MQLKATRSTIGESKGKATEKKTDTHTEIVLAVTMSANASQRLGSQSLCLTESEHRYLESALQRVAQAAA